MLMRAVFLGLIFYAATCGRLYASAFTVTDMDMGTQAISGSDWDDEGVIFPTNPLNTTHHSAVGENQATTIYDVLWGDDGGDFDFQFDHRIQNWPMTSEVSSSGTIIFNTHTDVMLDYDFDYAFSNLFYPIQIIARISVVRATPQPPSETLVGYLQTGGGGPTNGAGAAETFATDGHLLLEADNRFLILYRVIFLAGGNSSRIGVGSGSLHYSLTPVPEPGVAWLCILAGGMVRRRGRRNWGDW
ncbi:MAG: hypothetical protein H6819_03570 [Phycisphaerales bacterium]|nr:hypothetical protein [Phycisphaerales bacterium]MCB9856276.1 hypothetical protein [Phycisphaerales bacterium]MCB9863285.1 hypothetical protein [Phycisphaerales bacterium]